MQFKDILANGRCVRDKFLNLYIAPNDCGYPRLGISVGKTFGGAVVRNHLKRLIREAFRQNQDKIPADRDYVVTISRHITKSKKTEHRTQKSGVRNMKFEEVKSSFLSLVAASF
jgi:ribonuclease P protein component